MIVVEGPDGSGKSHLIKDLLETFPELQLQERHCDSDGPIVPLKEWVEDDLGISHVVRGLKVGQLYDRYPLISEPIYGAVVRGNLEPGFNKVEWLAEAWQWFAAREPLIIFCLPPAREVKANVAGSYQMQGVDGLISVLYWQYHTIFSLLRSQRHSQVSVLQYNYAAPYAQASLMMLKQIIRKKEIDNGVHAR